MKTDGTRIFSISERSTITCMELANNNDGDSNINYVLIANKNKELKIYKDKNLCYILEIGDNIFGMKFGTFNNVKNCIIMFTFGGALLVKSFNPRVNFTNYKHVDNSKVEKVKLDIPKKTSLYLDLVEREKESKREMHNKFIKDLLRIKYKAMNTYVKL